MIDNIRTIAVFAHCALWCVRLYIPDQSWLIACLLDLNFQIMKKAESCVCCVPGKLQFFVGEFAERLFFGMIAKQLIHCSYNFEFPSKARVAILAFN